MADIAERGAGYLQGARGQALETIAQAENEDFSVAEDLSVSDNYYWNTPNQPGIDPRTVTIRVMAPTSDYPNGYVVYMNDTQPTPQTVKPFTGQTIPPTDPYAHIPLPKR